MLCRRSIRCFKRLAAKTGLKNQSASPGLLEFPPASGGPSKSNGGGARIGNPALMRAPSSLPIPSSAKIRSHPPPDASLSRWLDQVGKRTQANIGAGNAGPHPIPGSSPSPGSDTSATLPQSQSDFACGPAVFAQALSWRDCARQYRRADRPSLAPQKSATAFAARRAGCNLLTSSVLIARRLPSQQTALRQRRPQETGCRECARERTSSRCAGGGSDVS